MTYVISGGDDDGKTFNIAFRKCTNDDWKAFYMNSAGGEHPHARKQKIIDAHVDSDTFWCPDAFDLSFWGMKGDVDSKTLTVQYKISGETYDLSGLKILMLMNNKRIVYGTDDPSDVRNVTVSQFTSLHWLPISPVAP